MVDFAFRQSRNAAYDINAALLDTDTDWNDKTRAAARKARVRVMPCEPCLEALLLSAHHAPIEGRMTAQLKQDFAARFGAAASDASILRYFPREVLDAGRTRISVLDDLLNLLMKVDFAG